VSSELDRAKRLFREMVPKGETPSIDGLRSYYEAFCARFPVPEDTVVAEVDAGGVPALWVERAGVRQDHAIVHMHGGGYVLGSAQGYRELASALSAAAGAPVLVPDFRLAPERPFPAAVEDGVASVRWAIAQLGASKVAVSGDSAGAGLVIATTVALRDEDEPLPAAVVCISPWVDLTNSAQSLQQNVVDPAVTAALCNWMSSMYLGSADAGTPLASPLFADLTGLPPTLIMVGGDDALRDDGFRLFDRLVEAGVDAELHEEPEMIHDWPLFSSFLPQGAIAIELAGGFIRRGRLAGCSAR
jgi:epsilon-lactone hydrolase